MRKTTLKHFAGLTYLTITNVPIKETEFGEVINLKPMCLEKKASHLRNGKNFAFMLNSPPHRTVFV